jgi:hypothetical protein
MTARAIALTLWLVAAVGVLASLLTSLCAALIAPGSRYARNHLVAHDQSANAATGGDPDETISSRLGKRRARRLLCHWICICLDRLDPKHCANSVENDEGGDSVTD